MNKMVTVVQNIVATMDDVLAGQFGLVPPDQYDVDRREGRIYVTGSFDPMMVGRNLKLYENEDTLRVLRKALGLPVVFTQKSRFAYVALASGKLNLPRSMSFPGFAGQDEFRLGVSLRGEISPKAKRLGNVLIGANQGAGKSNTLKLFVHQARHSNWRIYICDPDGHTFNPDVWNRMITSAVASSPDELLMLTEQVYSDIADRAWLFRQVSKGGIPPADLDEYNALVGNAGGVALPRIGLFVDEANSYLGNKVIMRKVADILRRGRKWGVQVFLTGHEWHKDVVPAELNDMLQTRIGLNVANQETANVVLRSSRWGKWVMGKPAGRGVIRIDQYQPMQFYLVTDDMEREWLSGTPAPSPLSEGESAIVMRCLQEAGGKMTREFLVGCGMGQGEARRLLETFEGRGWLKKDPARDNARFVTPLLAGFVSQSGDSATNLPTTPTLPTASDGLPTGLPTLPTATFGTA